LYHRRLANVAFGQIPLAVCIAWRKEDSSTWDPTGVHGMPGGIASSLGI
jgi:hypothetical protein